MFRLNSLLSLFWAEKPSTEGAFVRLQLASETAPGRQEEGEVPVVSAPAVQQLGAGPACYSNPRTTTGGWVKREKTSQRAGPTGSK